MAKKPTTDKPSQAKHAGGRPTDYRKEICDNFESRFAEGQSVLEVAVSLGVCRDTISEWAKVHPEFSAALSRGKQVSQAWWEEQGRKNLFDTSEYDGATKTSSSKRFNAGLWGKNVSNRFPDDWREKQDISLSSPENGGLKIQVEYVSKKE